MAVPSARRFLVLASACAVVSVASAVAQAKSEQTLPEARAGFTTVLPSVVTDAEPPAQPLADAFDLVKYRTPLGSMAAYLSKPRSSSGEQRLPAVVYLIGGFPAGGAHTIAWSEEGPRNDQSGRQFREAGIVTMYPGLRGENGNPGQQEFFYGEVDDVIAAADHLAGLPFVDPERVYLVGHSTGGTLALLVSECTDKFRAVFAFGPVGDPADYGHTEAFDVRSLRESRLRAPKHWLHGIRRPTFVLEGTLSPNAIDLEQMRVREVGDAPVEFLPILGSDHFELLAPSYRLIASRINALSGDGEISLDHDDVQKAVDEQRLMNEEVYVLRRLAVLREQGVDLGRSQEMEYFLYSSSEAAIEAAAQRAERSRFDATRPPSRVVDGDDVHYLSLRKKMRLDNLRGVFKFAEGVLEIASPDCHVGVWRLVE